jgi:hypothetical protein
VKKASHVQFNTKLSLQARILCDTEAVGYERLIREAQAQATKKRARRTFDFCSWNCDGSMLGKSLMAKGRSNSRPVER